MMTDFEEFPAIFDDFPADDFDYYIDDWCDDDDNLDNFTQIMGNVSVETRHLQTKQGCTKQEEEEPPTPIETRIIPIAKENHKKRKCGEIITSLEVPFKRDKIDEKLYKKSTGTETNSTGILTRSKRKALEAKGEATVSPPGTSQSASLEPEDVTKSDCFTPRSDKRRKTWLGGARKKKVRFESAEPAENGREDSIPEPTPKDSEEASGDNEQKHARQTAKSKKYKAANCILS